MGFSVPPRLRLERWALTPPFHPYRRLLRSAGGLSFCGTFRRHASRRASRVYPAADLSAPAGYAASRPSVFGLSSSPELLRGKRFSALPKSKAIYPGINTLTSWLWKRRHPPVHPGVVGRFQFQRSGSSRFLTRTLKLSRWVSPGRLQNCPQLRSRRWSCFPNDSTAPLPKGAPAFSIWR